MYRITTIVSLLALAMLCGSLQAANPKVVSSTVEDGQDDVDPALTEIRVQFDQPMNSRSWSIVGGGPNMPSMIVKPRWIDEKTIAITVALEPDHEYSMSLNSDTFHGFRSRTGESAAPEPLSFKTRPAGATAEAGEPFTPEQNRKAIGILRKAIDNNYSYRDRLKVDWDKAFDEHAPRLESSKTPNEFARAVARLLRNAQDAHVTLSAGSRTIGTHFNAKPPNFDIQTLRRSVANWKEHQGGAVSGTCADDIGYLMIPEWTQPVAKGLDEAFATVKEKKALIVDVRMNGGGDEALAQLFAGRFVIEPKVYSKSRIRHDGEWQGPFDRIIKPAPAGEHYAGAVAVLIGPKVASSCESFVLMMKQAPRCKLVGDTTKGSSGNPRPCDLGNGVTAFLPSWEDQLPDGTLLEGRGVTPDVAVTPINLRKQDAVLNAAIEAVRE